MNGHEIENPYLRDLTLSQNCRLQMQCICKVHSLPMAHNKAVSTTALLLLLTMDTFKKTNI